LLNLGNIIIIIINQLNLFLRIAANNILQLPLLMADRGQGRDLNLVLLVLEEPIDALLLGVLEHQNQETAGNQRV
jgi:hypothetical protein